VTTARNPRKNSVSKKRSIIQKTNPQCCLVPI